jgi:UDP-glucose 4-epimerase
VVAMLEGILGRQLERQHVATRAGDVRHSQADNSRLRDLFPGVTPVPLEVGLKATVEWMCTQPTAASGS